MLLNNLISLASTDAYFKTVCFFLDKNNNLQMAYIREYPGREIQIRVYNEINELTNYLNASFFSDNQIYLSSIYTNKSSRGLNIGKTIQILLEFLLQDNIGATIWGVKSPYDDNNSISQKELKKRANAFYKSAGYRLIDYYKFIKKPMKYPEIDIKNFWFFEPIPECLIAKTIKVQDFPFSQIDGWIFHENVFNKIEEIKLAIYNGESSQKELNKNV